MPEMRFGTAIRISFPEMSCNQGEWKGLAMCRIDGTVGPTAADRQSVFAMGRGGDAWRLSKVPILRRAGS
jgi:hypothetical protein